MVENSSSHTIVYTYNLVHNPALSPYSVKTGKTKPHINCVGRTEYVLY